MKTLPDRIEHDFRHHPPKTQGDIDEHETVRALCKDLALALAGICPEGRELSLALTKIEEAMFWSNSAIARHRGRR